MFGKIIWRSSIANFKNALLRFPALTLGLLCLTGYCTVLAHPFLLDDYFIIFNESGVSNKSFIELFSGQQNIFYRPVGHVLLWAVYKVFGTDPFWYRVVGLVLYFGICFLTYQILELLTRNRGLSLLAASLFTLHPVNNMLINNISAYVLLMYTLMLFMSFYFVVRFLETKRKIFYVCGILFFVLSLFCHEMSMMYPVYIFCLVYFLKGFDFKKSVLWTLPFILVSGLYFCFRMNFFTLDSPSAAFTVASKIFSAYLSTVMALIYWYVGKMFFPKDVIFLWSAIMEEHYNPYEIFRVLLIVGLIIYLIFVRWKKGLKPFALSIFAVGLVPAFWASYAHFPFAEPLIEPHWFYFSSLGFFIILANGLLWLKERVKFSLWQIFILAILAMYFVLLQENNFRWKTQESYCKFWIDKNGKNMTPYYGMGQMMLARGDGEAAIQYFEEGLKLSSQHKSYVIADIGYGYFLKGDFPKAQAYYERAINQEPDYSVTYYYLALMAEKNQDKVAVENWLLKAKGLYSRSKFYESELRRLAHGMPLSGEYLLINLDPR